MATGKLYDDIYYTFRSTHAHTRDKARQKKTICIHWNYPRFNNTRSLSLALSLWSSDWLLGMYQCHISDWEAKSAPAFQPNPIFAEKTCVIPFSFPSRRIFRLNKMNDAETLWLGDKMTHCARGPQFSPRLEYFIIGDGRLGYFFTPKKCFYIYKPLLAQVYIV